MKKYLLFIAYFFSASGFAQVGVFTKSPNSTLTVSVDLNQPMKPEGIIAPRLSRSELANNDSVYTSELAGAIVNVSEIDGSTSSKTQKVQTTGYYYFDGSIWQKFLEPQKYFYLPYFVENISSVQEGKEFDIYNDVYLAQLKKQTGNQFLSNNNLIEDIHLKDFVSVYSSTDFDYVITYFDETLIKINSISNTGVVNYDVLSTDIGFDSFINIVLVVK